MTVPRAGLIERLEKAASWSEPRTSPSSRWGHVSWPEIAALLRESARELRRFHSRPIPDDPTNRSIEEKEEEES
jgi:hypothetical protein